MSAYRGPAAPVGRAAGVVGLGASVLLGLLALTVVGALGGMGVDMSGNGSVDGDTVAPSALALRDIPRQYLRLYQQAGERYGLRWTVLAGIGKVECDHGRDRSPSCITEGAVNGAGAGGPMQFLASTWAAYGVDGDGDGQADRWDPADAIFAAARLLRAAGAPGDYGRAIFAYNHAQWYVDEVLRMGTALRIPGNDRKRLPGRGSGHGPRSSAGTRDAHACPLHLRHQRRPGSE